MSTTKCAASNLPQVGRSPGPQSATSPLTQHALCSRPELPPERRGRRRAMFIRLGARRQQPKDTP
eukprot:7687827-Alexandrium_andersonii.AAC.1